MNSLPKTVTRQRHGCNLNPGSSAPESSTNHSAAEPQSVFLSNESMWKMNHNQIINPGLTG